MPCASYALATSRYTLKSPVIRLMIMNPAPTSASPDNGSLRTALCQINTVVGGIEGNQQKIISALNQAEDAGCALAVFPELSICGYPPEDLLLKQRFIADCSAALGEIAESTRNCFAVVGFPAKLAEAELVRGKPSLYNAAAVCGEGRVRAVVNKTHLPNYAVFDEHRYFVEGQPSGAVAIHGVRVGVSICEDLWVDDGAIRQIVRSGSEIVVNINASPYHISKWERRKHLLEKRSTQYSQPFVYVNQVGGQDELVFDGMSAVFDENGQILARCAQFREGVLVVDIPIPSGVTGSSQTHLSGPLPPTIQTSNPELGPDNNPQTGNPEPGHGNNPQTSNPEPVKSPSPNIFPQLDPLAEIYEALKLGVSDYIIKNQFSHVCIGLSGGVDSSLVAAIAADAIGASKVHGVLMPSRYSSEHSIGDAKQLCQNLEISYSIVPIEPAHKALMEMLEPNLTEDSAGLTEENLQSRIRGIVLMAFANARGWLNLTTGNKSESAVGYSTLYGDTAGAFAVIKDVWKQQVYALTEYRNQQDEKPVIPENVLTKAPSAELRPGQRDDETLPPYEELDPLLFAMIEQDLTGADLISAGYEPEMVTRIARLIDLAEYKRRQNPPGIRITEKAFGKDRRMPITHSYSGLGGLGKSGSNQKSAGK